MKKNSRIRINPVSKEIEVEGSEAFVKAYFNQLQVMMLGPAKETAKVKVKQKGAKSAPANKAKKKSKPVKARPVKKVAKAIKKKSGVKKVTNIDAVITLIQGSTKGISTAELKEKTGLAESQIWNIVNRATHLGTIRKLKRGMYAGVASIEEQRVE
jgi:hypothetical protein